MRPLLARLLTDEEALAMLDDPTWTVIVDSEPVQAAIFPDGEVVLLNHPKPARSPHNTPEEPRRA